MSTAPRDTTLDRALELLRASRPPEAAALLATILKRDPGNERAWHMLSFALADPEQQAYALQRVLRLNPGNRAARSQLARILRQPLPPQPLPPQPVRPQPVSPPVRPQPVSPPVRPALDRMPGRRTPSTLARVARYAVGRAAVLALMVAVGVYLAIVVLNYGGYIDRIFEAQINDAMNMASLGLRDLSEADRLEVMAQMRWSMEEAYGLHEPFLARCSRWWVQALTFNWGKAHYLQLPFGVASSTDDVRAVILNRIPNTLLLAGTANLLVFLASIFLALFLSQRHGSLIDRAVITLSPISSVPNWVYGIVLTVVFAGELRLLPFGGIFDTFPPARPIGYVPIVLKHMILPVTAIFLNMFFQTVYAWRTFLLIQSGEEYIEMAKAQGLPPRTVERRYVLRPVLPYIMTSFTLMLINFWQGILVLELFFRWPGIGQLFILAVQKNDRGVSAGLIVVFALLLAISIFVLDILYAIVDPRVRLGSESQTVQPLTRRKKGFRFWPFRSRARVRPPARVPRPALDPSPAPGPDPAGSRRAPARWRRVAAVKARLGAMVRYPSAVVGLAIVLLVIGVSIYAIVAIPYSEAVERWRPEIAEKYQVPQNAQPLWVNLFRKDDLPVTIIQDSQKGTANKSVTPAANGVSEQTISFIFDYRYSSFPQDVTVRFATQYLVRRPFVTLTWLTPDGRALDLGSFSVVATQRWLASQDLPKLYNASLDTVQSVLGHETAGPQAVEVLFADPVAGQPVPLQGRYTLQVDGLTFEEGASLDAELVVYGQVYGLAGTDNQRRDLLVALLWGTPVALAFGLVGAVATSVLSMIVAAVGTWFGRWVDVIIQRITEVNMILPVLPMAIMVYYLYANSVWAILAMVALLSIFGSAIKNYRAAFLQVKESAYIEAARAYGAGHRRIILHYLVPRILPLLIPQLVIMIPTYVFFEATLAFLGISDPRLPTWGKVIADALSNGAFQGHSYWILEPTALMIITGLAFAMVGFALDSILNPRLRRM
jgi:peptide/nickel transport system permease protein